jgi:hypothetical protein
MSKSESQIDRMSRELETRAEAERPKKWRPPQLLPDPKPEPGYSFRWIRVSAGGMNDDKNWSSKLMEGYEPVKASEHPEIRLFSRKKNEDDLIEIGGLILCKIPSEFVADRNNYFRGQSEALVESVDNNFMRDSDARMPLFKERKSTVTFGSRQ